MPSLRDHEEEIAQALRRLEPHTPYAEVMAQGTGGFSLSLDKLETHAQPSALLRGAVFRAWSGTGWVEAATSGLDARSLSRCTDAVARDLLAQPAHQLPPGPAPTGRGTYISPVQRRPEDVPIEEWLSLAKTYFGWATSVKGIENAAVRLAHMNDQRMFLSTSGSSRYQDLTRLRGFVQPLAIENGKVEYDYCLHGGTGGWEMLDALTEELVVTTAQEAHALLTAGSAPAGAMTVVLDPGTAGTFAHESFGHGTEADQLLRDRSYLKPLLGQRLGPENITIVDDGTFPTGFGTISFDDEGFPAQRTVLMDHGVFQQVLHDRESAAAMGRKPTGNARRADFLSRVFVRMTNTFVEPGDMSFEELLEEAKEGVLLESCTSGIEDPLGGNMQIKVKKGHQIHHGKLGAILPSMALSGKVLEVLSATRGVGQRSGFEMQTGLCGKGNTDLLTVASGGPYLLTQAVVGPA